MNKSSSKLAKICAGIALAGVVLLAAGALALRVYLPPQKLRELVLAEARKALGREVRLRDASIGILSGVSLAGLEVSEAPDFKAGSFASADSIGVSVRWLPLLSKKVEVASLSVKGLRLNVVKRADGTFNFSDLAGAGQAAPSSAPSSGKPASSAALSVGRASVSGATIEYRDAAAKQEWTIAGLNATIRDFAPGRPFDADVSLKARGLAQGKSYGGALELAGTVDPSGKDPAKASVKLRKLVVSAQGYTARLSGKVIGLEDVRAELTASVSDAKGELFSGEVKAAAAHRGAPPYDVEAELQTKTPALDGARLAALGLPAGVVLPPAEIRAKGRLQGDALSLETLRVSAERAQLDVSGSVAAATSGKPMPDLKATAKLDLPALKSEELSWLHGVPAGLALPPVKLDAALTAKDDDVAISALHLALGGSALEAQGRVGAVRSPDPALDLVVSCKALLLDELGKVGPAVRPYELAGKAEFAVAAKGPVSKPVLAGKGRFQGVGVTLAGGARLSGFSGTVNADERRIDLPDLRGKVGDGDLALNLTVKNYTRAPDVDLEGSLSQADLAKLLPAKSPEAAKAPAPAKKAASAGASAPMTLRGNFSVGQWSYTGIAAKNTQLNWQLSGVTPDLKGLSGTAKLSVGQGRLQNLGDMATQSKVAKIVLAPFVVLQKVGHIAGVNLFPDFNNIAFDSIAGDYAFSHGIMTLRESRLSGSDANVSTTGTIDLPAERPDLLVHTQVRGAPLPDVQVGGTFDDPKTKVLVGKYAAEAGTKLLQKGANQLLKGILGR
ncbi:MAG TPA: AsmA-like C-terminal region-containing protein [Elusimicrobiota bacterium]|nr:AsmA-like C-terminal region-containing protein [Elusimicrobiota bacterium]